ncbi:ZYG11B (predicted) [Pycnogonum litorale]
MDCLCTFDDTSMNRMSVAICSILAAKISTEETSLLGSKRAYMKKLLHLVRVRTESSTEVDTTMKFTLSALWNLTDESPTTCNVFLEEGGLELFLKVMQTYQSEAAVETKVLGLLNNIAEVPALRMSLLRNDFIVHIQHLMKSQLIDVSYFAAGIIAHLASSGEDAWSNITVNRKILLTELNEILTRWEAPEGEMVAYR